VTSLSVAVPLAAPLLAVMVSEPPAALGLSSARQMYAPCGGSLISIGGLADGQLSTPQKQNEYENELRSIVHDLN
jgi:hypothetical protein